MPDAGPPTGKPIQVQLSAVDPTGLNERAAKVAAEVAKVPGVIDISDGLPPPGVDWSLEIDRSKAAQFGVSPMAVGTAVQLVTTGLYGWTMVVTGTGPTIEAARAAAYDRAAKVAAPNIRYRLDIGDRLIAGDFARLERLGLFS